MISRQIACPTVLRVGNDNRLSNGLGCAEVRPENRENEVRQAARQEALLVILCLYK
jgi:hypothetical protein